ncbi:hypothetical protein CC1G_09594 [Coprinopsis cinerea okayama7|uniref:Uncharacterized protein n=1 Tax=Coprinopsis cinerea (strain Okayama-7 / 130 / ATCC MYA-4618 / FGSC 9003) TaxID=240176 RepID=A8N4B0_COPC7|nr:hypothetical protein CC1G_09594 [Coprinopsis cinerea okayama7\|eukprot:XP_001829705.1 hypothetical protein CC1G_09594 [Coprinopsis cinerea okayama7\
MPLTVDQVALRHAASVYAGNAISMFEGGIQLFMCLYGLVTYLETPKDLKKGRASYIVMSFTILALSLVPTILGLYNQFRGLYYSSGGLSYISAQEGILSEWPYVTGTAFTYAYVVLGDGLLLYRCYIIWQDFWWVTIVPGMMYLAYIGIAIYYTTTIPTQQLSVAADARIYLTISLLTVLLNIILTSLLSIRLLRAQRDLSKVLPNRDMKLYTRVVAILIESAVPLTVFSLVSAVLDAVNVLGTAAQAVDLLGASIVFNSLYTSFAALSPQMIIFWVTTGRSWTERGKSVGVYGEKSTRLSQPIAFSSSPVRSESLVEEEC